MSNRSLLKKFSVNNKDVEPQPISKNHERVKKCRAKQMEEDPEKYRQKKTEEMRQWRKENPEYVKERARIDNFNYNLCKSK